MRGEVNPGTGWVLDYGDITRAVKRVSQDFQSVESIFARLDQPATSSPRVAAGYRLQHPDEQQPRKHI